MKKRLLTLALLLTSLLLLASCKEEKNPPQPEPSLSHTHQFSEWSYFRYATCIRDGIKTRVCECGELEVEQISAFGHRSSDWKVVDATCTAAGYRYKVCTNCSERTAYEVIPAYGHTYDVDGRWRVVEPDCINAGYKTLHCTVCNTEIMREIIPALGHDYISVVTAPGPDTIGYTTNTCSRCGDEYIDDYVAAFGVVHFRFEIVDEDKKTCKILGFYGENENTLLPEGSDVAELLIPKTVSAVLDGELIEYKVVTIGKDAFAISNSASDTIVKIVLPDTVTVIEDGAFSGRAALSEIRFGPELASIGASAFDGCASLAAANIPETVKEIGPRAFALCKSLTQVVLPDTVTVISDGIFDGCSSLKSVSFSDRVEGIGERAFADCVALDVLPELVSVKSVGSLAFFNCKALESITFGSDISFVGAGAFFMTEALVKVEIPSVKDWLDISFDGSTANPLHDGAALYANSSKLTSLDSLGGQDRIGDYQFYGYTHLTSIRLPASVTYIGDYAFFECTGLKTASVFAGVERIGNDAFSGCTRLASVSLPDTLTVIGLRAFYGCTNISSIRIPDSVELIGEYAFANCTRLSLINLDKVKGIDGYAFFGCKNLTSIDLSENISFIENSAFEKSGLAGELVLPEGIIYLGERAFADCNKITSVTVPESLERIGKSAFVGCEKINRVNAVSLNSWCSIIFENLSSNPLYDADELYIDGELLEALVIDNTIDSISDYAFFSARCVKEVYFVGTPAEFAALIGDYNAFLNFQYVTGDLYYFSATEPVTEGRFWYYNTVGNICKW